jgi:hypothetical protein
MDIRSAVFDLIDGDLALRALGVAHGCCGRHGQASCRRIPGSCFIVMEWDADDNPSAPAGAELLTIRAHLPSERSSQHLILDLLLHRTRAVLSAGTADGPITSLHRGTTPDVVHSDFGTVFKTSMFQVAPRQTATAQPGQRMTLSRWTGYDDLRLAAIGAVGTASLSMN